MVSIWQKQGNGCVSKQSRCLRVWRVQNRRGFATYVGRYVKGRLKACHPHVHSLLVVGVYFVHQGAPELGKPRTHIRTHVDLLPNPEGVQLVEDLLDEIGQSENLQHRDSTGLILAILQCYLQDFTELDQLECEANTSTLLQFVCIQLF